MKIKTIIHVIGLLVFSLQLFAGVKYDEGRVQIDGIQLLQDSEDDNAYYYLTRFVKLAQKEDGSYEFLCIKYIGEGEAASGGIFHALVEFSLPQDVIDNVEAKLKSIIGENARIAGPVPMRQFTKEGQSDIGKFNVVSSILNNTEGEQAFTTNVLTSGFAPLLPNSKAAIAAKLTPSGTTLLWESLQGATSDVSVSVHGYYEAVVKGYNAVISAEASSVYEHYSRVSNSQGGFTKSEMRNITDKMIQDQIISVEVFDRSEGLGIDTKNMQGIVDIITEKLIETMFDTQTGWSKKPEGEVAVESGQIKGRQDRGWFESIFGGKDNTEYYSDNQYVKKKREDIKINKFYLNLSKSTTIKVPVHTSGNIGGIYNVMKDNDRYFRVVNLADSDFQKRTVHFQIDGEYTDAFNDIFNSVSVAFRKVYKDGNDASTSDLLFTPNDIKEGKDFRQIIYPRLGITGSEWMDYEYKISWNLKGDSESIEIPKGRDVWTIDNTSLVALVPPFNKKTVDIDADITTFKDSDVRTATVRFFVILNGKATSQRTIILRETDAESTLKTVLYHDPNEPLAYQVTWYGKHGKYAEKIKELKEDYLFLMTPTKDSFSN